MTDHLTPARRSWNMSRIRGMNTGPERVVRRCAYRRGLRYRIHVMTLAGRPDMVFTRERVAVFIDGDFWHGWHFSKWSKRLSTFWKAKIEGNRKRDRRNFARLRRAGWHVVRLWEHQVRKNAEGCVDRIEEHLKSAKRVTNRVASANGRQPNQSRGGRRRIARQRK
jgi:DNA mismatch endonuclease (patch repair protein)